jgi:vacuolar-type H+-ATPase catalytic subunit A/Vma1
MLSRFGRWFASSGGVWQTAVIVIVWWLAEFAGLIHDPQHFQLCVWLTIYSAITQPVLAWVNKQDMSKSDQRLDRLEDKEDQELELLKGKASE